MIRVRPAGPDDLSVLTQIIADVFSVKMHVLFGRDRTRILAMLARMYRGPLARGYDGLLLAELDRQPVGALAIEPMPWYGEDIAEIDLAMRTELSGWRRWWNHLGFGVFSHGPEDGDAYLTDVSVIKSARRRGVATALVQQAEVWAVAHHRRALSLWVASNNPTARHVYERIGMVAVLREFNVISGLLYGIPSWTYMRKSLTTVELPAPTKIPERSARV